MPGADGVIESRRSGSGAKSTALGPMPTSQTNTTVDALIVTAIKLEYHSVLAVNAGALPDSKWQLEPGPTGLDVALREFKTKDGRVFRVAVTRPVDMGATATANAIAPLIPLYSPRVIAMCGVCAGKRGEVELGDVIIADRLWTHDAGKLDANIDAEGQRIERLRGDITMYNLHPVWKQAAENFIPDLEEAEVWLAQRPRSLEAQTEWFLERLLRRENPSSHSDRRINCANYPDVLNSLWMQGWVEENSLRLTNAGRKQIETRVLLHPDGLPQPKPFQVQVGPIATGNRVIEDPEIFDRLAVSVRKTLGLEMEASAIGAMAHLHRLGYSIVMKGVMDHADGQKNDQFKSFAARASAECLIAFLRAHLPPRESESIAVHDDFTDVLDLGLEAQPKIPSPAQLLDARYAYVPFYGDAQLNALEMLNEFCEGPESAGAWLIHGDGGVGKTRLLLEQCKRLVERGWEAGFLHKTVNSERFEALLRCGRSVLIVIDYAESRPVLRSLLEAVARRRHSENGKRVRIVLLARNADDWWLSLKASDRQLGNFLGLRLPFALGAFGSNQELRKRLFCSAADAFLVALGRPSKTYSIPSLDDSRFDRALYVQMAALAVVEGLSDRAESLVDTVLDHEEQFWRTRSRRPGSLDLEERRIVGRARRAMTALTLTGGASSRATCTTLLERAGVEPDRDLIEFLADLYPARRTNTRHGYIAGLEPDLLGEAMVWRTLSRIPQEGDSPDDFLNGVFDGVTNDRVRTGFEVLGRLSEDHPVEVGAWLRDLLQRDLQGRAAVVLEAVVAVGTRTAHSRLGLEFAHALQQAGSLEIAQQLAKVDFPDSLSLLDVSAWIDQTLLSQFPSSVDTFVGRVERSRILNRLCLRLNALGRHEEALIVAQEAVDIRQQLAQQEPNAFSAEVAASLHNLSLVLGEFGRREESLKVGEEALQIHWQLAQENPRAYLPVLVTGLSNLSLCQCSMGQLERALESASAAVYIARNLAAPRSEYQEKLAASLLNLGLVEGELGKREDALTSTLEAVSHYRELANTRPEEFLPNLALAATNLNGKYQAVGKREEALEAAQEAVNIWRKLAFVRPEAFLPELAMGLSNLGVSRHALGEFEAGLESVEEAIRFYERLSQTRPIAFLPHLSAAHMNRGLILSRLGRRDEALASAQHTISIDRELARQNPGAFSDRLAMNLGSLGIKQNELGLIAEALASISEAVIILRELTKSRPDAFLPELSSNLNNLSLLQSDIGRKQDALASLIESVSIQRELAQKLPAKFLDGLIDNLTNLGVLYGELNSKDRALECAREAVEHCRKLAQERPQIYLPDLAACLNNLCLALDDIGNEGEALPIALESVEIRRKLVQARPESYQPALAESLNNLSLVQRRLKHTKDAASSAKESADIRRALAQKHPDAFLSHLAASLNSLSLAQADLGLKDDALRSAQEAFDAIWPRFVALPEAYRTETRKIIMNLGRRFGVVGVSPSASFLERLLKFERGDG